jgi:hypothetical protein
MNYPAPAARFICYIENITPEMLFPEDFTA